MSQGFTTPTEAPALETSLTLPYTLSAGRAAGTFLAELANQRIVGSRCSACQVVLVPAQDFCGTCGDELSELVEVPGTGTLTGFTPIDDGILGLVRLDGAGCDLLHRILDAGLDQLAIGQRVCVRWAAESGGSILDIAGFVPGDGVAAEDSAVRELVTETEPISEKPYELELHYRHAYGPYYGRLFDELAGSRRILGVKCPSCQGVLVPPRERCDVCYVRTEQWVDVADTGVLKGFSIIHLKFVGQLREPPYVYAEIVLDGAATRLIHTVGGIDVEKADTTLRPGMPVRAVWKDDKPTGTLQDILHFEPC
ncbi:MAG: Zn-ribbon domain-containing OB-fold protein [Acidimicrobiales bacterium]